MNVSAITIYPRLFGTRLIGKRPTETRLIGTLKIERVPLERVSLARNRLHLWISDTFSFVSCRISSSNLGVGVFHQHCLPFIRGFRCYELKSSEQYSDVEFCLVTSCICFFGRLCVGDRAGSARLVLFKHICRTDVGGDGSGGFFSAAAGQPHHSITL